MLLIMFLYVNINTTAFWNMFVYVINMSGDPYCCVVLEYNIVSKLMFID